MNLFKQSMLFMALSMGIVNAAIPDCLDDCARAYNNCLQTAGSNMEKAVCKDTYTKCTANC